MTRPNNIKHYSELQNDDNSHYEGSDELLGITAKFGRNMGLTRIGVNHDLLPPGRRISWPHAESDIEEFVYVIEGHPDVWIDGELFRLDPGDGVSFPPGTGSAHTFINNTEEDVRLLVIGDATSARPDNKLYYPLNPTRQEQIGDHYWHDAPIQTLGDHDGLPDQQRNG